MSDGGRGPRPVPARRAGPGLAAVLLAAVLFALVQHPGALSVPFVGDDYFILDKTREAPFLSVWEPRELVSRFYRPWSRELHYWTLQRLFGDRVLPYHAVGLLLWAGVAGLYFALVRRLAGPGAAAVAVAAVMALAGWGTLLVWVSGAQDLWMALFALLALHAVTRGRPAWACAAQLLALLSKETAVMLPAVAFALEWLVLGRRPAEALRRALPLAALTLAWAALHPLLGGRLWWPRQDAVLPGLHPTAGVIALRTLLATANLHAWPAPEGGWPVALRAAVPAALVPLALGAWGLWAGERARSAPHAPPPGRVALFGALWALLGWLPLLMPTVGWHAYYALFGALGAWLALAPALARARPAALAAILGLALLGGGLARTPSADWGSEWFQRRAAAVSDQARAALLRLRPSLPSGSRVFLGGVPGGAGLLPGGEESPALRHWYRDRGLRVESWARYRAREAGDRTGEDVFFRYDPASGWREVVRGAVEPAPHPAQAARWRDDHERLAVALARGGDWNGTFEEYAKLARAFPAEPTYPYYAGLARVAEGDSLSGLAWMRAAAALPGADGEIRAAARELSGGR